MFNTIQKLPILFVFLLVTACGSDGSNVDTSTVSKPLNDTGIRGCGDYAYTDIGTGYDVTGSDLSDNGLECSTQPVVPTQSSDGSDTDGDIIRGGQDAFYGRDTTHDDDSDGHAGFSFTQLDSSGVALAAKSNDYATTPWSCVKDNVTGLIWEVKTTAGLQNGSYTYTWYNSSGINDGGDHGIGDTGAGITTGYEFTAVTYAGSDLCLDNARCDIEKYVADVNSSNGGTGLCGATDWRLPSKHELLNIVNNGFGPAIDTNYFPNVASHFYWSSQPYAASNDSALTVNFSLGYAGSSVKDFTYSVRLVRGSQ